MESTFVVKRGKDTGRISIIKIEVEGTSTVTAVALGAGQYEFVDLLSLRSILAWAVAVLNDGRERPEMKQAAREALKDLLSK